MKEFLTKLRHEWKTAAFGVVTTLVGIHDLASAGGYDLSPIIPDQYRPYAVPAIGISFLALRRWKNKNDPEPEQDNPSPKAED
jgi:hypothetical protein